MNATAVTSLDPILTFGETRPVRLINVPCADVVAREIFDQDCYEFDRIPDGSIVLDVGAFYGEFGLRCAIQKGCAVLAYEPCAKNREILRLNYEINGNPVGFCIRPVAVGTPGRRAFMSRPDHPAGSMLAAEAAKYNLRGHTTEIDVVAIGHEIASQLGGIGAPIVVKLDCEGAEHEIFADTAWLNHVDVLVMEWHARDGAHFKELLKAAGFVDVSVAGSGPKPRPPWEPGMAGGLLWAYR